MFVKTYKSLKSYDKKKLDDFCIVKVRLILGFLYVKI